MAGRGKKAGMAKSSISMCSLMIALWRGFCCRERLKRSPQAYMGGGMRTMASLQWTRSVIVSLGTTR